MPSPTGFSYFFIIIIIIIIIITTTRHNQGIDYHFLLPTFTPHFRSHPLINKKFVLRYTKYKLFIIICRKQRKRI